MEAIQNLLEHRSIRKYKSIPIAPELLEEILHAGFRASTTGNMQVYSVVVTQDEEKKKELAKFHFNQPMIFQAPVLLTFCADFNRFDKWCRQRKAEPGYDNFLSFFTAAIDALLVAQNVVVAAEDKGLGICYLGTTTYMANEISVFLNLPKSVVPITTLVVGYPDEKPELTDRLPDAGLIHFETYRDYTPEQIDSIYADKEALPLTQELIKENNLETLAQVFTQKRYTKNDNVIFSQSFLRCIERAGFMNNEK